jgi:hypothetical protein
MDGNIFNSKGVHVGVVMRNEVFGLKGQKLYDLKGSNIYKLNGDFVDHLSVAHGTEKLWTKQPTSFFRQPDFEAFFTTRVRDRTDKYLGLALFSCRYGQLEKTRPRAIASPPSALSQVSKADDNHRRLGWPGGLRTPKVRGFEVCRYRNQNARLRPA